eukprot:m.92394 g.92394  ORF g.92394 m.92394 type:complete len:403 (+) comp13349_c0_seq2:105-1313(+)
MATFRLFTRTCVPLAQTRALSQAHIDVIKATAPVVAENAVNITKTFYPTMFERNPEVLAYFNPTNQKTGAQPEALANSIIAYATHIDNLDPLASAVDMMAHKHVALLVQPEHYSIVGENLMIAIGKVLGDAVTPDVAEAWGAAYQQLADICIGAEEALYKELETKPGGWRGKREFRVTRKVLESPSAESLFLDPVDGGMVASHIPGQYLTFHFNEGDIPGSTGLIAPRHYSLASRPGYPYQIIVRNKDNTGLVSSFLHNEVKEGDILNVSPPCGVFHLNDNDKPKVFVSGGIGVTAQLPMALAASDRGDDVTWIASHVEGGHLSVHVHNNLPLRVKQHVVHTPKGENALTAEKIMEMSPSGAEFYLCGPAAMTISLCDSLKNLGVDQDNILYHCFGPHKKIN